MNSITFGPISRFSLLVLVALLGAAGLVQADFKAPDPSAAAIGRSGGNLANVSDSSAVAINPARLTELTQNEGQFSAILVDAPTEIRPEVGFKTDSRKDLKPLGSFFVGGPIPDSDFAWGLGLYMPYGMSSIVSEFSHFRYTQAHSTKLTYVNLAPTIAVSLTDKFSVGGSLDFVYSEVEFEQAYPWALVTGFPGLPDGEATLEGDDWTLGGTLGANYDLSDRQRLAFKLRLPTDLDYSGSTELTDIPALLPNPTVTEFGAQIRYPMEIGLGYGIDVTDKLNVGIDIQWIQFSRLETMNINAGVNSPLLTTSVPFNLKDAWHAGIGVAYEFLDGWTLRGGYRFEESPIEDRFLTVSLPGYDQHIVSAGLGYRCEAYFVDLAYSHSFYPTREVSNNVVPSVNGEYDYHFNTFAMTVGFSF
ncbi:MAG: outer membrane protein transport protein [Verrucomicrobiota bacterium]